MAEALRFKGILKPGFESQDLSAILPQRCDKKKWPGEPGEPGEPGFESQDLSAILPQRCDKKNGPVSQVLRARI